MDGKPPNSKHPTTFVDQAVYVPCAGDTVLGIVVDCRPDNFPVGIEGPILAFLPVLAFGGTRRNIPKFEIGTLLYLRVVKANNSMNPELACTDGECVLSTHRHSCRECNHELRDAEWDTTKNYGGETH